MATRELIDIILRLRKEGSGGKDVKEEMEGIAKGAGKASGAFDGLQKSWGKVVAVGGAVAGAFYTLKKAYDFGKEGAAILQTSESFDRLMSSMGAGPGVLQALRDASRGTVDDMTLMSSTMTLLAGTSETLGSAIVDAAPQLMEIAKAANKLNPTLGDTAFLYQSLATGIKRSSPMILDNLGLTIKVADANEKYAAKIGKTVEQLTAEEKQMALLNAALEAGDRMIQQVGGSTEAMGDSFASAEAQIKNAGDQIKASLAPAVAVVADEVAEATPKIMKTANELGFLGMAAQQWIAAAIKGEDATRAFNETVLRAVPGLTEYERQLLAMSETERGLARETERVSEKWQAYADALNAEAIPTTEDLAIEEALLAEAVEQTANHLWDHKDAAFATAQANAEAAWAAEDAARAHAEFSASMDTLSIAMRGEFGEAVDEFTGNLAELDEALAAGEITADEYKAGIAEQTQAIRDNTEAIMFNIAEKQILDALEKGLIEDTNASGTAFDEANTILWTLAETLGMVDEETLALMESVQSQTQAMIEGDTTTSAYALRMAALRDRAIEAAAEVDLVGSSVNNLPSSKDININVRTTYTGGPTPVELTPEQQESQHTEMGTAYQHGGQFVVRGPAGPDRVPVGFWATRGEVVTVTPVGGTPPPNPAVTNNFNLNVSSTQPSQGIQNDFYIMQALAG